jgi:hypothetical protein
MIHRQVVKPKSLADNEFDDFEFLLAIIIWYEILSAINLASKQLQAKDMVIDIAIERVQGLISFFTKYREIGFSQALEAAREVAFEMDIDPEFRRRTKRKVKRKRQFDEAPDDDSIASQSAQESFRVNYFIAVVDQAIASLTRRFEQYTRGMKIILVSCLLKISCVPWMIRGYFLLLLILRLLMEKNCLWS